jgi:cobalt-zinc-cadmium resistance protein CzcA
MKKIADIILSNKLIIIFTAILISAAGITSYKQLDVEAFPDVSPVLVQVFTVTDGLAPEEVEKYITYPVESAMTGIPGIKELRSVSNFGLSVVNIYFSDKTDIYFARQLVSERLSHAQENIPEGFGTPEMGPIATGQGQILYYYLKDTENKYSQIELRDIQDWNIKLKLQTIPGVAEVLGIGGWEKQFKVDIKQEALLKFNISINEIIKHIEGDNLNVGAQYIEKNGEQFIVRSEGLIENITQLETIIIKRTNNGLVRLKDVAEIHEGGSIRRGLQTRNGEEEIVAGMVIKLIDTNSSEVISAVEKEITEISKTLPEGVEIVIFYNQKELVQATVKTINTALLTGIILVIVVLIIFLKSLRPSLIVSLSIPFSIFSAFIIMHFTGMSANLMSFGGLAIAIGMIVDGSIVLIENIDKKIKSDISIPINKAITEAFAEIIKPVIFSVIIIIAVFIPLFTLDGVEGKTFKPLAFTVALAMGASLIYTVTLAPALSSYIMKRRIKSRETNKKSKLLTKTINIYEKINLTLLKKSYIAVIAAVILTGSGIAVYTTLGSEFTPKLNEGDIMVNLTFAPSASITESKRNVLLIEKQILKISEVSEVVSRIGRGEVGAHSAPVNVVHTNVLLKNKSEWRKGYNQEKIENEIRKILTVYPGVVANITQPIQLSVDELVGGVKAELALKILGDDLELLEEKSEEIIGIIQKINGAADVQMDQMTGAPQIRIVPDRIKAAAYGLELNEIQNTIKAAIGGVEAGEIFQEIKRYGIYVRYKSTQRDSIQEIKNLLITGNNGQKIPLSSVAEITSITGPRQILRENTSRFAAIQCNVVGRDIGSFVEEAKSIISRDVKLPDGYTLKWGGQFELQQKANKRLLIVIPVTLILIAFLIFYALKSVKNTILILINIPLALIGGIFSLKLGGLDLSVPASVGFISLFGIALSNGLVLITYMDELRLSGKNLNSAVTEAAIKRLRPVLMTAATTALGLIPLLASTGTGSEVQRPLAAVVTGGLITSTIVTLFILPSFYKIFHKKNKIT